MKTKSHTLTFRILIVSLAIFLTGNSVLAQAKSKLAKGIHFRQVSWTEALALSKKEGKPIFVDAFAVWCGPCKQLKAQTFNDPALGANFNERFINISLDTEKGDGVKFADEYEVNSYPTLLFIDSTGKVIKRSEGFVDAAQLAAIAATVKGTKDTEKINSKKWNRNTKPGTFD